MKKTYKQLSEELKFLKESIDLNEVKKLYDQYNRQFFGDQLPTIKFRVSNSLKKATAMVVIPIVKRGRDVIDVKVDEMSMVFNGKMDISGENLKGILLHEMIHVYHSKPEDVLEDSRHGLNFLQVRKHLAAKSGIDIPITDSITQLASDVKKKEVCIIFFLLASGQMKVSFFNKKVFDNNLEELIGTVKKYLNHTIPQAVIMVSNTVYAHKYPISQKLKRGSFPVYSLSKEQMMEINAGIASSKFLVEK